MSQIRKGLVRELALRWQEEKRKDFSSVPDSLREYLEGREEKFNTQEIEHGQVYLEAINTIPGLR